MFHALQLNNYHSTVTNLAKPVQKLAKKARKRLAPANKLVVAGYGGEATVQAEVEMF